MLRKLIYRPKVGTLRAKWLKELKLEKELKVTTQFAKKRYREMLLDSGRTILFKKILYDNYLSIPKVVLH
jgi:hypothetical protein